MELLSSLNPQQQQAVVAGLGPVLVLAGPGSGKTRVLTQRIAYLIGQMGVRPYQILAVTFTNKAAREMEGRVLDLLGDAARGVTLGTFHAICARILRREAEHLPVNSNYVIFDSDDQEKLVRQALADLNIDDKQYRPAAVHGFISNAKNELMMPEDYPAQNYRDEVVKRVYARYQQLLLACNALDFDDLLLYTARLLEQNPEVRAKYARRFEHVLVDEFQDTNAAQYMLLRHLASFHGNLYCVGDVDQSIYRFRGADYRNVLRYEKDYPDTQVILLEQNYRSTQRILDVAMAVIDRHPQRKPKKLFTDRGQGQKVILHELEDDRQEASYIVDTIRSLVSRQQARPGDFAVMYRTNAQSRVLEEAFLHANQPYKLVGAQRFYGRREIKDVIAFLRLAHNPGDELSLTRVLNVPPRGIGEKTFSTLRQQALKTKRSMGDALMELGLNEASPFREMLPARGLAALAGFGARLAGWRALAADTAPMALLDRILEEVGYHAYIDEGDDEGRDRWDNVMELRRLAAEYHERSLSDFLQEIALVSDQDTLAADANAPTLLTLHAAKGLEFPIVFLVGLSDGTLPHQRSFDDPEAMHEERRLLYVGITRAKDQLYLTYPQYRSAYGYAESTEPSRFLRDIPLGLLEMAANRRSARLSPAPAQPASPPVGRWQPAPAAQTAVPQRYSPGMKVLHPAWGNGLVLNSRLLDGDETVDVFFDQVGLKRVIASLAKMEIL